MNMMKNDLINYDYISVKLKKDKANQIINYYKKFQWELIEQRNHKYYDDIIEATFKRKHFILNKDEFQLQQIYLENELNKIGKLIKNKYSRTISVGISLALLGTGLVVLGILLSLVFKIIHVSFGFIVVIIGIFELIYFGLKTKKNYNDETIKYTKGINECYESINKILEDLEKL